MKHTSGLLKNTEFVQIFPHLKISKEKLAGLIRKGGIFTIKGKKFYCAYSEEKNTYEQELLKELERRPRKSMKKIIPL